MRNAQCSIKLGVRKEELGVIGYGLLWDLMPLGIIYW